MLLLTNPTHKTHMNKDAHENVCLTWATRTGLLDDWLRTVRHRRRRRQCEIRLGYETASK